MRASAMRANFFVTVWAFCKLRNGKGVMGPAGRGSALRMASFRIRHSVLVSHLIKKIVAASGKPLIERS